MSDNERQWLERVELEPLERFETRVIKKIGEGDGGRHYVRLRGEFDEGPRVVADQIWVNLEDEDWMEEIAGQIIDSNLTVPMRVELLPFKGKTPLATTSISPMQEAIEAAMKARVARAQIQGESQMMIAMLEMVGRLVNNRERMADRRERRLLDSYDRIQELRTELHRATLDAEFDLDGLGDLDDGDPRWKESLAVLKEVFGPLVKMVTEATPPKLEKKPDDKPATDPEGNTDTDTDTDTNNGKELDDPSAVAEDLLDALEEHLLAHPELATAGRKLRVARWATIKPLPPEKGPDSEPGETPTDPE